MQPGTFGGGAVTRAVVEGSVLVPGPERWGIGCWTAGLVPGVTGRRGAQPRIATHSSQRMGEAYRICSRQASPVRGPALVRYLRAMVQAHLGTSPSDEDLLRAPAVELAARIRARKLSSAELVEATIARMLAVNPLLNAVVHTRLIEARAEARAVDEQVRRGEPVGPLAGVPCTIKEFFAVTGAPQTAGLVARRGHVSQQDAPLVARLRAAGAIVIGTTNVPEGGIWGETYNALYGRTNNPRDLARTSGGSSGGEGAIVASGGSVFGLGSDIGGSVRIPAAFCGIVGHKPSGRLLPNGGQFPAPKGPALAMLCPGPMVRSVRDVMPLLRVMAGPDPSDPFCRAMPLGNPEELSLRDLVVHVARNNHRHTPRDVMVRAVDDAAHALARRGATVREFDVTKLARGLEIWAGALAQGADESYDRLLATGQKREKVPVMIELAKLALGRSHHTLPALAVAGLGGLVGRLGSSTERFARMGAELRAELDQLLGDRGVLLHPPYTRPAPRHHDMWRTPFDAAYTALFNVLETPVTVLPIHYDGDLPVAVQVIAAPGRDHVSVRAALALEEEFGGFRLATPEPRERVGRARP